MVELGKHERVGEEDGVVEESLADHKGEAQERALRILLEHGGGDLHNADRAARADGDRRAGVWQPLETSIRLHLVLDLPHDGLRLVDPTVYHKPARALREFATHPKDNDAKECAEAEAQAPADAVGNQR